ncbi:hypothetical protein DEU56DRAFT_759879 [Suillus clintonianus]|uniref:uncharacterized protein n=1 Tax=Suillus clintonianus TaxID=1904413 RepID=UPI001B872375|nr:uncharacterized protein DEU56DRAFT_759879 [Suillus clintonianus]KAG2123849.1 hypothetical protein DEU56DRAFT_759879 [Suillus clintonianus]
MPPAEDSDDFMAALDAAEDTDSESNNDERDSDSDTGNDLRSLRMILAVPQPDAPMHEVRKALKVAQQAYTNVRSELRVLRKEYATLQAAIPAHRHNQVLKKTSAIDSDISHAGKINSCWSSPDVKLKGAMAELYLCVPKTLHKAMETYTQFGPLFHTAVSSERSNILHVIKDCAGLIFSSLKLNPTIFTDKPSKKKENKQLLALLKKNGEGEYTCLAPILFKDPGEIVPDDFPKSPVLVKIQFMQIICVEIFGKAVLSGKTKGHPKARGQRWATQCMTEGLIVAAAILVRFLLSHNHELMATGPATKVEYQRDFDFYLEQLFKCSSWAISIMDYYNKELDSEAPALAPPPAPICIPQHAPAPALREGPPLPPPPLTLSQLSLQDSTTSKGCRVPAAAHKRHTAIQQAQLAIDSDAAPPPAAKCVTRGGSRAIKKTAGNNISPYYTSEQTCIISRMIRASGPWAEVRYILNYDGWAGHVIIPDRDGVDEWADGHEYSIDGWAEVVGYYVDGFTKVDVYQIAGYVLDYDGWAGRVIIPDGDRVDEWADGHEYSIDGWAKVVGYYVDGYQIAGRVGRGSGEIFIGYTGGPREL